MSAQRQRRSEEEPQSGKDGVSPSPTSALLIFMFIRAHSWLKNIFWKNEAKLFNIYGQIVKNRTQTKAKTNLNRTQI